MDKALKARKMASASMRKQRMQERERQKDIVHEQREERKRRMLRVSQAYSSDGSDSSRPNSPENDSSAETPSEYSLRTPENFSSPDVAIQSQAVDVTVRGDPKKEEDAIITSKPTILERRRSRPISTKQPMFTSSLNRPCDFRYDRFSTFVDPIDIPRMKEEEMPKLPPLSPSPSSSSEEDGEEEEGDEEGDDYSPIELATPVAIRMPISRPSVVAVVGATTVPQPGPQKFSVKNINTIMINPPKQPTPRPRIVETLPTPDAEPQKDYVSTISATKSVETIAPSSASIISVEPYSTRSVHSTATLHAENSVKKKSSMPMLTKFTHARMNSIKNFMKPQSISGPPPAVPMIPSTHQPRPSESMSNILLSVSSSHRSKPSVVDKNLPPSPRRSLTEPTLLQAPAPERRPQTARSHSQNILTTFSNHSHSNITALPPAQSPVPPVPQHRPVQECKPSQEEVDGPTMNRKKSFSSFRRRSGSLGQALKFGSSNKIKPSTPEAPLPPMPMIKVPTQEAVQAASYASQTPKTPRSTRKSGMMYSPFPPASQKGEPVGLGLRI